MYKEGTVGEDSQHMKNDGGSESMRAESPLSSVSIGLHAFWVGAMLRRGKLHADLRETLVYVAYLVKGGTRGSF